MIVEMRTYTLKPGTVTAFERNFEKDLPGRLELSPLGAFWHSEVGKLHQVIHMWPYESTAERDAVRAAAYKLDSWPPDIRPFVEEMEAKILIPAPFCPPMQPSSMGPLFEIFTSTYSLGSVPRVIESWESGIQARMTLSPLIGAWRTEIGPLNQWIHIWGYSDAAERTRVRDAIAASGAWPPALPEEVRLQKEESLIVAPAAFSPIC